MLAKVALQTFVLFLRWVKLSGDVCSHFCSSSIEALFTFKPLLPQLYIMDTELA